MSNLTVKVLSNVSSSEEVFDHLVQVERLDTGEIGELLCSHCCRWPAAMLEKAKWIEGCYTPQSYEADPRLLLGYHPSSVTSWEYEEKGEEVFVHLRTEFSAPQGDDDGDDWAIELAIDLLPPLPFYNDENVRVIPRYRFMRRLWESSQEGRDLVESIRAFYRSLAAVVESGRVPLWAARTAWFSVLDIDHQDLEDVYLSWAHHPSPMFYEEYADALIVMTAEPAAGFMPAVAITEVIGEISRGRNHRRRRQRFAGQPPEGTLVVLNEALLQGADQNGWHPSVRTKLFEVIIDDFEGYEEKVVLRDDFENGWAVAIDLRCYRHVLGFDYQTVAHNQPAQGFARAVLITELI